MNKIIDGKVAIITGASRGIGRGLAKAYASAGAKLAICARTLPALESLAEEIRAQGGEVFYATCDITDTEDMKEFVTATVDHYGRIDILVNNAMKVPTEMKKEFDHQEFKSLIDAGIHSTAYMTELVIPHMRNKNWGRILNFTSIGGMRPAKPSFFSYASMAGYGSAKAGIIGLTRATAAYYGEDKITANCVAPMAMSEGWQEMLASVGAGPDDDPFEATGAHRNKVNYAGDPEEDIAPMCIFLCSEQARYITGAMIPIDGGLLDFT